MSATTTHASHEQPPAASTAAMTPSQPTAPTESQLRIITHPAEPNTILKVNAGPGSGKTFTLAHRIAHLINQQHFNPNEILVLSMSNRAVHALRESLVSILGEQVTQGITINTFHSFCSSLVDDYSQFYIPGNTTKRLMDDLSWRNFSSIFSGKTITLDGETVKATVAPAALEGILSDIKSNTLSVHDAAAKFNINPTYLKSLISYMNKNGIIRYQDLITNAIDLMNISLKSTNDVGDITLIPSLARYKALVVDEFQDMYNQLLSVVTAVVRYPTTATSNSNLKHLTITGDPNQSIYEFLGSNPRLMQTIESKFPGAKVDHLHIVESFRSTAEILQAATEVGLGHHAVGDVTYMAVRGSGCLPIARTHKSQIEEYVFIVEEIVRLILQSGGLLKPCDFAILTRYNREIEEISKIISASYDLDCAKLTTGNEWVKTKLHIFLDIIHVLIQSAGAEFSLLSLLLRIDGKIGSRGRVSKIFNDCDRWANANPELTSGSVNNLETYLRHHLKTIETDGTTKSSKRGKSPANRVRTIYKSADQAKALDHIKCFLDDIERERENLSHQEVTPREVLESLLVITRSSGLMEYINRFDDHTNHKKKHGTISEHENMLTLQRWLSSFNTSLEFSYRTFIESQSSRDTSFLSHFLRTYNDEVPSRADNKIKLSTIHTAKGLEFPVVFVVGTSKFGPGSYWESLIADKSPGKTSSSSASSSSSKSRLFYVACTRARNLLYLGSTKPMHGLPDDMRKRFTDELPNLQSEHGKPEYMKVLSADLQRPIPSLDRISQGRALYDQFVTQKRGIHTHGGYCFGSYNHRFLSNKGSGTHRMTRIPVKSVMKSLITCKRYVI